MEITKLTDSDFPTHPSFEWYEASDILPPPEVWVLGGYFASDGEFIIGVCKILGDEELNGPYIGTWEWEEGVSAPQVVYWMKIRPPDAWDGIKVNKNPKET